MGRFSPGVSVIPALRRGYLAVFSATVCAKLDEIAPNIKCGAGCDKRGNDGILSKQMANVNTP